MIQGTQTYHYHHSATGHTMAMTDSNETLINQYAYSPYGRILGETETSGLEQPFKYVGKYGVQHEGNELYYMRARYYDADTGRFIKEDPIGIEGGLNVSLYGNANPVVFVDPSGLLCEGCESMSDIRKYYENKYPGLSGSLNDALKHANGTRDVIELLNRRGIPPVITVAMLNLVELPTYIYRTASGYLNGGYPKDKQPGSRALQGVVDIRNNYEGFASFSENRPVNKGNLSKFNDTATAIVSCR